MTPRDMINRRFRKFKLLMIAGAAIGMMGIAGMALVGSDVFLVVFLTGFFILMIGGMIGNGLVTCPLCGKAVDSQIIMAYPPWRLTLPEDIRFCRACGRDLSNWPEPQAGTAD